MTDHVHRNPQSIVVLLPFSFSATCEEGLYSWLPPGPVHLRIAVWGRASNGLRKHHPYTIPRASTDLSSYRWITDGHACFQRLRGRSRGLQWVEGRDKRQKARCHGRRARWPSWLVLYLAEAGEAGLAKFRGKGSDYVWKDTYVFVSDCDKSILLAHPIRPEREGSRSWRASAQCEAGRKPGGGWFEYPFPKPGAREPSRKISYVLAVRDAVCGRCRRL
jgi:hypothetical protein